MTAPPLSGAAFEELRRLFEDASGIDLGADKLRTVQTRLACRLDALQLRTFEDYCHHLRSLGGVAERLVLVDLLTTHETYFFREPRHFQRLAESVATRFRGRSLRVWSAACSSGEEAYSLAMTLSDVVPSGAWELLASDISPHMIDIARTGIYPMKRLEYMPPQHLKRFCLRGIGAYDGMFQVAEELRNRVAFFENNLLSDMRPLGAFDAIFVRNVLIYFGQERREDILRRMLAQLRPRGLLFVGHAEPLQGLALPLRRVDDAVFEGAESSTV